MRAQPRSPWEMPWKTPKTDSSFSNNEHVANKKNIQNKSKYLLQYLEIDRFIQCFIPFSIQQNLRVPHHRWGPFRWPRIPPKSRSGRCCIRCRAVRPSSRSPRHSAVWQLSGRGFRGILLEVVTPKTASSRTSSRRCLVLGA